MNIKVIQGAIQKQDADVLVVNLFAGSASRRGYGRG